MNRTFSKFASATLAVLVIAATDAWTGREFSIAALYVVCVAYVAFLQGLFAGIVVSLLAAGCAVLVELMLGPPRLGPLEFAHAYGPWLNAAARAAVHIIITVGIVKLRKTIHALENALTRVGQANSHIRMLEGLLPICAWCKDIRDDAQGGRWVTLAEYIARNTAAQVTHGICPRCAAKALIKPY